MSLPAHLSPDCQSYGYCNQCQEPVKQDTTTGRWFITMGHAGFNSRWNNGAGYATRAKALRSHRFYAGRIARYAPPAV